MPSSLRYFCCACGSKDHRADYSIYPKPPKRKHNKSKSSTCGRRRLLDNEQNEEQTNGASFKQMVFHTESKNPSFESHDSAARLVTGKARSKRRKVQELFPNESFKNDVSRTTFPWMDENFVPNGSSNIRLGVSSVQLHARRKLSNGSNTNIEDPVVSHNPDAKDNANSDLKGGNYHDVNSFYTDSKYRNSPSESQKADINGSHYDETKLPYPVSLSDDQKSKLKQKLSATNSSIQVKKVSRISFGNKSNKKVPKLDELNCLPPTDVSHLARPQRRPYASVQNVFNTTDMKEASQENRQDISFSSGVSFKSNRSAISERSQKSVQPVTVVPKPSSKLKSPPPRQTPKAHPIETRESMYGYIPKIVQSVQASNALEGSKIDDFFIHCRREQELNSFASAQEIQTPRSQNQQVSSNMERSRSVPSPRNGTHSAVKQIQSETNTDIRNRFEIQQITIDFGSQDSLDTDSIFTEPNANINPPCKATGAFESVNNITADHFSRYSKLEEEQSHIPFIDQEPDLIQGLENIQVVEIPIQSDSNKTIVPDLSQSQSDKKYTWEHSFSSQNEYIESIPLRIPCPTTPPLLRRGEANSDINRASSKAPTANNHWLGNLDSEVLY